MKVTLYLPDTDKSIAMQAKRIADFRNESLSMIFRKTLHSYVKRHRETAEGKTK